MHWVMSCWKAKYLCNREQCIQNKFRGNRGNYITLAQRVVGIRANLSCIGCDVTKIRMELTRVLKHVDSCNIEGKVNKEPRPYQSEMWQCVGFCECDAQCSGTGWRITADEKYPGLLPCL